MKNTILILFMILQSIQAYSCCAEKDYRLVPIGEINNEIVFIEFDFFRNCKKGTGGGSENEFWINGTINLMKKGTDSLTLIENIDTIQLRECICTYKNYYSKTEFEKLLQNHYKRALLKIKSRDGFNIAIPKKIMFNDTLNTKITEKETDSTYSYVVNYKNILKIDVGKMDVFSCYPDKVSEVRTYETNNYEITILRLRCRSIKDEEKTNCKNRFLNIETAFWKENPQWHGIAKDYYTIKKKKY